MSEFRQRLGAARVVPVIVVDHAPSAEPLSDALLAGGLRVAEITLRTAAAVEAIRRMARSELLVGAGTVIRAEQVDEVVEAGARFVVSPGFSRAVVRRCQKLGVPCLPGVATATDIMAALELGVETLKFFPAEAVGGFSSLAALAAPFPDVRFVPTGGITPASAERYLAHPAVLAVGGSWMVPRAAIGDGRWDEITELVRASLAIGTEADPAG